MPPLPTEYVEALDNEGLNLLRVRFSRSRGQIKAFVVQYEIDDGSTRIPVVRYDSVHIRPHRDMMFWNGERRKVWLDDLHYNEVVVFAVRDIRQNWQRYREAYYQGHQ
jgi:hypothetical protein